MKILAAAINARFNHTNIAVRSIVRYVQERLDCHCDCGIEFAEWTINMSKDQILRGMTVAEPDMILVFKDLLWSIRRSTPPCNAEDNLRAGLNRH